MALNTDSLYRPLKTIKADLLKVIDELDALNSTAISFGGAIGTKLPVNVNSLIEKVENILSSGTPDSVDGILEFLDAIPMGEIREKSAEERAAMGAALSRTKPSAQNIDMSVNPNAPKSAIAAREGMSLEDFYKENFRENRSKFAETDYSWDAILNNPDIEALDLGDITGGAGHLGDIDIYDNSEVSDNDYAGGELNDYTGIDGADENGQIADESLGESDWRVALSASDPIEFGSVQSLAENIRDTGGKGPKSANGIDVSQFHVE